MTKEARELGAEPAFPTNGDPGHRGLSLRDYLAAAAMRGLLTSGTFGWAKAGLVAKTAIKHAEALLEELAK